MRCVGAQCGLTHAVDSGSQSRQTALEDGTCEQTRLILALEKSILADVEVEYEQEI